MSCCVIQLEQKRTCVAQVVTHLLVQLSSLQKCSKICLLEVRTPRIDGVRERIGSVHIHGNIILPVGT
jgi:hypothetical protein